MADVVVVGAGVGGLSAAIYARLKGHQVLVLEAGETVGGKAAGLVEARFKLDPGPSIIILTKIYDQLFRDAGRDPDDYVSFTRLDPISRVYFGEQVIDLPDSQKEVEKLIQDLAPQDVPGFMDLMGRLDRVQDHIDKSVFKKPFLKPLDLVNRHLIATGLQFDVRATYKEMVDRWFSSPLLRAFFYGFPSYGGQSFDSKAPGALMIPYLMIRQGVFYPKGGVAAIPRAMLRLAKELGVEFQTSAKVTAVETRGDRVIAVMVGDQRVQCDVVISNVDRLTMREMIGHKVEVPPSLSYFTMHWGVKSEVKGLLHHTLVIPDAYEAGFDELYRQDSFPKDPIVYLNATNLEDPETAPPGCTNLFAVVTSPSENGIIDWEADLPEFQRRTMRTLEAKGLAPPAGDIVFTRVQTPRYFAERHGNYKGSLYGPIEQHRHLGGLFPLPNRDENFRNLLYCGGSVQPGAGLPMVTLSGKFAADLI